MKKKETHIFFAPQPGDSNFARLKVTWRTQVVPNETRKIREEINIWLEKSFKLESLKAKLVFFF